MAVKAPVNSRYINKKTTFHELFQGSARILRNTVSFLLGDSVSMDAFQQYFRFNLLSKTP